MNPNTYSDTSGTYSDKSNTYSDKSNTFPLIKPFCGGPFSQWYACKFTVRGKNYNCAEQFMMAGKARLFQDAESEKKIMSISSPRKQKSLGRKVSGFDAEVWNGVARQVVFEGNLAKFRQNPALRKLLVDSGESILVEASPYDKVWGVGLAENDPLVLDPTKWLGSNWLGEVLMKVRGDL